MSLNGWQRLWCMSGLVYLIIILVLTVLLWPSQIDVDERWVHETIKVILGEGESTEDFKAAYENLSGQELVTRIQSKYSSENPFREELFRRIDQRHEESLERLSVERKRLMFSAFFIWLGPMIGAYLMGVGIRWVRVGFEKH